jgi:hypothetical protein
MNSRLAATLGTGIAAAALSLAGCGSQRANPPPTPPAVAQRPTLSTAPHLVAKTPLPAESNPPGDIPDTQAFVTYASPALHFLIDAPEGWSRTQSRGKVMFHDKFDGESVQTASGNCTSGDPRTALAESVLHAGDAVTSVRVESIALPAGPAHRAWYEVNSAPEPVTNKRVRLAANAYLLERDGRCALIMLWAPLGADNVDQWQRIARSFRWR